MNGKAAEIGIHAEELDNYPPSSMAQDAFSPSPFGMYDALGCLNSLELNV